MIMRYTKNLKGYLFNHFAFSTYCTAIMAIHSPYFFSTRFAQDLSGGMTLKASLVKRIPLDAKYAKASRKYGVISRELGTEVRDQNAGNQRNLWINRRIAAAI